MGGRDSSGGHVQELLCGGGEHRIEGGGQVPAFVGQRSEVGGRRSAKQHTTGRDLTSDL